MNESTPIFLSELLQKNAGILSYDIKQMIFISSLMQLSVHIFSIPNYHFVFKMKDYLYILGVDLQFTVKINQKIRL